MGQQSSTSAELNEDPWYRPDLMTKDYDQYGDAYEDNTYEKLCEEWKVTTNNAKDRYLRYVDYHGGKDTWLHLRLLADFMHVGTHPKRWKKDPSLPDTMPNEKEDDWKEQARRNRFQKMKVTRLDYYDNRVKERKFEPTSLKERTQKLSKLKDLAPKLTNWINLAQELAQELTRLEDFAQKPGSQQLAKELTEWKELARELSNFKQLVQKLTKWEELAQELAKLKDLAPELAKLNALVQKLSAKQLAPELTEREDLARELPKLKDVGRKLTGLKQPPQELEAEQLAQDLTEWEDLAKQPGTEELTQELTEWKGLAQNSSTKELNTLKDIQFRLYVVEDLSRDVIEVLGSGLGIEPSFFRAHIVDYAWYNVRDRWRDPPTLNVDSRQQNWIQLRYVTARYFESEDGYKKAEKEAEGFNILRRPDDDLSNRSWWDKEGAKVGLTRARATFWLKPGHTPGTTAIGVLLLDPTVKSGVPLWRGRRNWYPTPDPNSEPDTWKDSPHPPEPKNFYDDFLWWAQRPERFSNPQSSASNIHVPMQALLHLICSEWWTMSDYIKTRLCQIDLELVKPKMFATDKHIDHALEKLNMWRRFVPVYREMITETLEQVFHFPCHTEKFSTTSATTQVGDLSHNAVCACPLHETQPRLGSITAFREDFMRARSRMEERQSHVDRLTHIVTAVIQIEDRRRALRDAHNLGRLSWLATLFIPFSLVATLFCMQPQVTAIDVKTVQLYFATSLPLAFATILVAWALSLPRVQKWFKILGNMIIKQIRRGKGKKEQGAKDKRVVEDNQGINSGSRTEPRGRKAPWPNIRNRNRVAEVPGSWTFC